MKIRSRGIEVSVSRSGRLSVTDRKAGRRYESPWPIAVPRVWWHLQQRELRLPADGCGEFKVERAPDSKGLLVHCVFASHGISLDVLLRLDGRWLIVRIPTSSIRETCPHDYRLLSVDLLGGLGAGRAGQEGFLFRPERAGSITRFTRGEAVEERHLSYSGYDLDTSMPVFGVSREKGGFLGVVHEGDADAGFVTRLGWGDEKWHAVCPELDYRYRVGDDYDPVDREVRLCFLEGSAGYVEMASAYREYLLKGRSLATLRERAERSPALTYALGATNVRFYLGCKVGGIGHERYYADFAQVAEGLKMLHAAGVDRVQPILVGWHWEGGDGRLPSVFPINPSIGGEAEFVKLARTAADLGYPFGIHENYTDIYEISPEFSLRLPTIQADGSPRRGGVWAGGHCYHCCPKVAYERFASRDMPRLAALGVRGMSYCDAFPGPWVYKCYSADHPLHRREAAEWYCKTIRLGKETYGSLHTESYQAFASRDLDYVLAICADLRAPREVDILLDERNIDLETPFWHIAHHGIIATAGGQIDPSDGGALSVLKNIEYGCVPAWEFVGISRAMSEAAGHEMAEPHEALMPNLEHVLRAHTIARDVIRPHLFDFIAAHEEVEPGVRHTAYSSGAELWVNRSGKPSRAGRKELPPRSWARV